MSTNTVQQVGLFEGYGGLSMAVTEALGAELVAYSEIDPGACRLLAHHYPDVPNLGDVTTIDWDTAPVDPTARLVLTGGFPCQDVSSAGRRAGLRVGTRSGLWAQMAYAIDRLHPDLVVIENVRGLLSADAACDLEPCPWCVGDDDGRPLRALGAVLGDLADLGYDARWGGLRAADVGAPHGRFRVFIVAFPAADAHGQRHGRGQIAGVVGGLDSADEGPQREREREVAGDRGAEVDAVTAGDRRDEGGTGADRDAGRPESARGRGAAADTGHPERDGGGPAGVEAGRRRVRTGPADRGRAAPDADGQGPQGGGVSGPAGPAAVGDGAPAAADAVRDGREGRPERDLGAAAGQRAPRGDDAAGRVLDGPDVDSAGGRRACAAPDSAGADERQEREGDDRLAEERAPVGRRAVEPAGSGRGGAAGGGAPADAPAGGRGPAGGDAPAGAVAWGDYAPAVRRWELILDRPAPAPTQTGARGGQQLSPRFVEWMQGLPEGHVTDVPGLSRNAQLKLLGNGVVPQQAAAALRWLLAPPAGADLVGEAQAG